MKVTTYDLRKLRAVASLQIKSKIVLEVILKTMELRGTEAKDSDLGKVST